MRQHDNVLFFHCHFSNLAVAPVVPELTGDADTSNFEDISGPEGSNETFELTKVGLSWPFYFYDCFYCLLKSKFRSLKLR